MKHQTEVEIDIISEINKIKTKHLNPIGFTATIKELKNKLLYSSLPSNCELKRKS